jgi:primase-polymerase (primpol)-like protein
MSKNKIETKRLNWLEPQFQNIPDELKKQQWAVWKAEPRLDRDGNPTGKYNKAPRNPLSGIKVGANQPEKFGTFKEAREAYETGRYTGVGVLLTGNGITGIDIDDAAKLIKERPEIKQWLKDAIDCGAHCEISPSGEGYRAFIYASLPQGCRKKVGPLEIYNDVRFLTVTGNIVGSLI